MIRLYLRRRHMLTLVPEIETDWYVIRRWNGEDFRFVVRGMNQMEIVSALQKDYKMSFERDELWISMDETQFAMVEASVGEWNK